MDTVTRVQTLDEAVIFYIALIPFEKVYIQLFSFLLYVNNVVFNLDMATGLAEWKIWILAC